MGTFHLQHPLSFTMSVIYLEHIETVLASASSDTGMRGHKSCFLTCPLAFGHRRATFGPVIAPSGNGASQHWAKPDPAGLIGGDVYLPRDEELEAKLCSGHWDTEQPFE